MSIVPVLRTAASNDPYQPGGPKRLWLTASDLHAPTSARLRAYCEALLSADQLEVQVPHLADIPTYLALTDPEALVAFQQKQQAAKKSRRKPLQGLTDMDDWDLLQMQPKPKKQRAPKRRAARQPTKPTPVAVEDAENDEPVPSLDNLAPVEDTQALLPASSVAEAGPLKDGDSDSIGELMHLLQPDSDAGGGVSPAATAHYSEGYEPSVLGQHPDLHSQISEDDPDCEKAGGGVEGSSNSSAALNSSNSSSNSSSSGSSSSSSSSEPPKTKRKGKPKPKQKSKRAGRAEQAARPDPPAPPSVPAAPRAGGPRDRMNRIAFGGHHLTPRFKDGSVVSYQMSCRAPDHNKGSKLCRRELSVQLAGGEQECRRVLKAWVLLGPSLRTREEHMDRGNKQMFIDALAQGSLLDEDALDNVATAASEAVEMDEGVGKAGGTFAPFHDVPVPTNKSGQVKKRLLGAAGGVPREIHQRMEELAASGGVPVTTLEQRRRNKLTGGTSYFVPAELQEALHNGYLRRREVCVGATRMARGDYRFEGGDSPLPLDCNAR